MKSQKKLDRVPKLTEEEEEIVRKIQRKEFMLDSALAVLFMLAGAIVMILIGMMLG